jgi:sulfoacetaldehyde dehydrogenase
VGVVEHDKENGIMKIAKPIGVIGALLPVTNGEATPFVKAIFAIKTRNAVIMAPHPKAQKTNDQAMAQIRGVLKKHGWPEDLVIGIEATTLDKSKELIKQVDLILATGGGPMVKAAYSSGKPAHGVGAGNALIIVDETADLKDAADKIMRSKTFDHATKKLSVTMTLGCGTWGGNSTSSNVSWEHLLNYTWVSYPIPST